MPSSAGNSFLANQNTLKNLFTLSSFSIFLLKKKKIKVTMIKSNVSRENEISPIEDYKKLMNSIAFMEQYLPDPDVFNPNSPKFTNFLIKSFAHLHSDFHYLSFLNKEDIDQEIVKVSSLLQILPLNSSKKILKLFENMTETEIHKFWLRFFTLFNYTNTDEFSVDSIFSTNLRKKTDFFKDINTTFGYLNYNFAVVNTKNLASINIDKEVAMWKENSAQCDTDLDNSTGISCDSYPLNPVSVEKLIIDLKLIVTTYSINQLGSEVGKQEYSDFFTDFINLTKDILKYKNDLHVIDSSLLNDLHSKMLSPKGESDLSAKLYFIKRCNNLIMTLKSKIRAIEQL